MIKWLLFFLIYPFLFVLCFHFIKGYYSPKRFLIALKDLFFERKYLVFLACGIFLFSFFDSFLFFLIQGIFFLFFFLLFPKNFFVLHRRGIFLIFLSFLLYLLFFIFMDFSSFFFPFISTFFLLLLSHFLLYPFETMVKQFYIKKAAKKIKSMESTKIIGITGSFGKTTMKTYLSSFLRKKYFCISSPGNVNTLMGLTKWVNQNVEKEVEFLVVELGIDEKKGMKKFAKLFSLDFAFITGIGPVHLSTFRTLQNVAKAKSAIQFLLKKEGKLFIEHEAKPLLKPYILTSFSCYGENIAYLKDTNLTLFQKKALDGVFTFKNHEKISDKLFMDFIKTIPNTPRRFEIKKQGEITLIDDSYNINPYGAKFAIEYLKKQDGVRIIITGGLLELGKLYTTENYDLGVQMKGVDKVILITKKKKHPLLKGYLSTGEKKIQIVKTLKESIPLALQIKGKKTILLLAKGDDFFLK